MGTEAHRAHARNQLDIGILTISTTRSLENDKSGHWIRRLGKKEGHRVVFHKIVPDDQSTITETLSAAIDEFGPDAVLLTGGTGISAKDVTIEAVRPLFDKELTAFAPIFAQLSFMEIDSAALISRATAGIIGNTLVFCMPGSLKACKLACAALIFPELGHLAMHLQEA